LKVFIIAEAGVNHNGSFEKALELIQVAKDAGADAVKFQTFVPELVMTSNAAKAEYQIKTTEINETQLEMAKKIQLPLDDFGKLKERCDRLEIEFMSTAFDEVSVETLRKLGLKRLKIPSGEITNLSYLRQLGRLNKPIVMSTGMATLREVKAAMDVLIEVGIKKNDLTILHCNTQYPTPMADANLKSMLTIQNELGVKIGYSDHTLGIEVPIAAVAMGATIIEKHFTLARTLPGPDHKASLEPDELKSMVRSIRNIEKALGNGIKHPSQSEIKNIPIARKSIVARKSIKKGEVFSDKNLTVKRPGTGISPMKWDEVVGKFADKEYQPDDLIV